jgi:hypothetical protein
MLSTITADPPSAHTGAGVAPKPLSRWVLVLQVLGAAVWLGLVTWRLDLVPGMAMDEGWAIISARGQWAPANPLSGMSSYTGALPVLLLKLLGTKHGLLVLRGASVIAHAVLLVCVGLMLRGLYPRRVLAGWALPLIATTPLWLLSVRSGMEVMMFTAPFAVLGFYLLWRRTALSAFFAGVVWGLLVYNHVLGLWAVAAIVFAWLVVYRRWQPRAWWPALVGFGVGLAPRVLAMALYDNAQINDTAASLSLSAGFLDLAGMPSMFWSFLHGGPAYLRLVGRLAQQVLPYWVAGLAMFLPWLRHWRAVPRAACFVLLGVLTLCFLTTLGVPYFEMRFWVLPVIGVPLVLVLLGAGAIVRDARWGYLVRPVAAALVACNLYYAWANFYQPWQSRELGMVAQRLGTRSPPIGSWHFLPKDELVRELSRLDPPPLQVVSPPSITRPLRALMDGLPMSLVTAGEANRKLPSVYVDYRSSRMRPRMCFRVRKGNMCFSNPTIVDRHFVVYRRSR